MTASNKQIDSLTPARVVMLRHAIAPWVQGENSSAAVETQRCTDTLVHGGTCTQDQLLMAILISFSKYH